MLVFLVFYRPTEASHLLLEVLSDLVEADLAIFVGLGQFQRVLDVDHLVSAAQLA